MIKKNELPTTALRIPMSRTCIARLLKRSISFEIRPKSFTSSAPPMFNVSFIIAFIWALWSIACLAISRSMVPIRRAATINNGKIIIDTRVNRHSNRSITTSTAAAWIRFVIMLTRVLLIAFCAPTTSLFNRLIISPTLVLVKKRKDIRCR